MRFLKKVLLLRRMNKNMNEESLKSYWINKLLFPKIFMVDKPGVIISKTSRFFGCKVTEKRNLYHFDEIFLKLRIATVKKMGSDNSSDFFYRMGKDLGVGYMVLGNANKIPSFLLEKVVNSIHKIISTTGTVVFDELSFSPDGKCILSKRDGAKKLKDGNESFFAGVYSGILSFLSGHNFEPENKIGGNPKVIIKPSVEMYTPDMKKLKLPDNYFRINLPSKIPHTSCPSFSDLLKFGKIKVGANNLLYNDKIIFSTEQSMFDLITRYYVKEGLEAFFRKNVVDISKNLADEVFNKKPVSGNRLKEMINMFCAFGWGVPEYTLKKKSFDIVFLCAPVSKSPPLYRALIFNGFLNSVSGDKYVLKEVSGTLDSPMVKFCYNKV